jgi:PAS domain S-box-containing protein
MQALAVIPIRGEGRIIGGLILGSHTHDRIPPDTSGVIEDIAAHIGEAIVRVRMAEELQRSEERYRAIVESQPQMICRYRADGVLTFANRAFRSTFGLGEGGAAERRIYDFLPGMSFEALAASRFRPALDGREGIHEELYVGPDASPRVHRWRHFPLFDSRGDFVEFQSIGEDQTEEMQRRAEMRGNEIYAALGRMATIVAHELKSPLTSIKMNVDMLQRDAASGAKSFVILDREIRRMQFIIRDILDFARQKQLHISAFHLADLIEELLLEVDMRLRAGRIAFINAAQDRLIDGDHEKVRAAFLNIVANAIDAARPGGWIRISTEEEPGRGLFRISIRDNGTGIGSPEKIFDPFFTTKTTGTGLGLPIAKRIFEQHKWELTLKESTEEGTEFVIAIPMRN